VLSTSHHVNHQEVRLTSLESQVTELTEMVLKISSCRAHSYKSNKRQFDFPKAVQGRGKVAGGGSGLFVEGRTKICSAGSTDLVETSSKGRSVVGKESIRKSKVVLVEETNGGGGRSISMGGNDETTTTTDRLIDELKDRVAALEHGMEALHSLLSSSNDDVDQELASLSATLSRLQERIDELEMD
jgi:hypothetical protein